MLDEKTKRLRIGFIGCGGHAWRNIFPALQFAPVELVATCDLDEARARRFARGFGAERCYTDFREMIEKERPEACYIVTGYDREGRPLHAEIAKKCMQLGAHAWIEKPPSRTAAEIDDLIRVSRETGKLTMVGFKKAFTPAATHLKEVIGGERFGRVSHAYIRYPLALMTDADKSDPTSGRYLSFLDHVVHPASLLTYLFGPARRLLYRQSFNGSGWATLEFGGEVIVALQCAAGQAATSFLERVEVVGEGANITVDNGVKLTYYRAAGRRGPGGYGGATDYIGEVEAGPVRWEPEFSLGVQCNKALFLLGYAPEVAEFAQCLLEHRAPTRGGLEHARQVMAIFEAFLGPEGEWVEVE